MLAQPSRLRRLPAYRSRVDLGRRQILSAGSFAATASLFVAVAVQLKTGFGGSAVSNLFTNWLYDGVGFAAALTCAVRGSHKGERAWLWIAAGVLAWTAGDVYYTFALQNLQSPPFPSLADLGYLGFYVPVFIGLGLLVRRSVLDFDGVVWLDGLIGGFTVCAVATGLVLGAVWSTSTGTFAAVATNLAYPAGDALLLALVFCVLGLSGWKLSPVWGLLGGGLLIFAVADSVYLVQVAHDSYRYGSWLDLGWPAGFVLIAAGSFAPSTRRARARLDGMPLLLAPVAMALICLGIEVWDHFHRVETVALVSASLGLLAVIGRLAFTFKEYIGLLQSTRAESLTDALTGLGNRRALVRHLDEYFVEASGESLLMLFDLDGFKAYNDAFGHGAGDALLERLGRRLRDTVGERGSVFRLGGDEFCILISGGSIDLPWVRAATSASLRESGDAFVITCSSGHTLLPTKPRTRTTPCRSPIAGCTQRRVSGSAEAKVAVSSCKPWPSGRGRSDIRRAQSPGTRPRSLPSSGSSEPIPSSSGQRPSCTTWASSPCRRPSSRNRACSTTTSGR